MINDISKKQELLSVKAISTRLGLNVATIRRYIKEGRLKGIKIGKSYRIKDVEFNNLTKGKVQKNKGYIPQKERPRDQKYKLGHLFPEINSPAMEAIVEISSDLEHIEDLKNIISMHAKECIDLIAKIENEGIHDTGTAINLLILDEAIRNLSIRRDLYTKLLDGNALILLPLPPHLSDSFISLASPSQVLASDDNLPPHLKHSHYRNLNSMDFTMADKELKNVTSIILEGYIENNNIYIRNSAAILIYQLASRNLNQVFIHSIPHIPPHSNFVELNTGGAEVVVSSI